MIEQQLHRGLEAGGIFLIEPRQPGTVEIEDTP